MIQGKKDSSTKYFSISLVRLALFSILTFGFYDMYWFYKHWKAIKEQEGLKISPLARSLWGSGCLYCYSLFKRVIKSAKSNDYPKNHSAFGLSTLYLLPKIFTAPLCVPLCKLLKLLTNIGNPSFYLCLVFLVFSASLPALLLIQKMINFNNKKIKDFTEAKRKFSIAEAAVVLIGVLCFTGYLGQIVNYYDDRTLSSRLTEEALALNVQDIKQASIDQKTKIINNTVTQIKKDITLPAQIDNATTLIDISAGPNAIRYHYRISNAFNHKFSNISSLKTQLITKACQDQDTIQILDTSINLEYYYDLDMSEKYLISLNQGDCSE